MPKPKSRRPSRKRAILTAFGQLGWHAKGKDVVALLANFGIEVNEGLVSKVRVESLKRSDEVKLHQAMARYADKRRMRPMNQKRPPQRTYHR